MFALCYFTTLKEKKYGKNKSDRLNDKIKKRNIKNFYTYSKNSK